MKLYDFAAAPSPRRVRIFLAEKGIALPSVQVDLATGEQFSAAYRAINPCCAVPALSLDDGSAIAEVQAIWLYLEGLHPDPPLLGTTPESRARILMWDRRMEMDGYQGAAEAFRNAAPTFAGHALVGAHGHDQIPALVERGRKRTLDFYDDLDARLEASRFIAGDAFTVADITAVVTVDFAVADVGLPVPARLTALRRWHEMISSRPSMTA
jgi:glutathione S-transferase